MLCFRSGRIRTLAKNKKARKIGLSAKLTPASQYLFNNQPNGFLLASLFNVNHINP